MPSISFQTLPLVTIVVGLALGYGIMLVFIGLALLIGQDPVQARVKYYIKRSRSLEDIELQRPFFERVILPAIRNMSKAVTRFAPQFDLEAIRLKLDIAGNPNNLSPNDFLGLRGLAAAVVGVITFALMLLKGIPIVQVATLTIGAGGIGFYLPVLWINRKVRARQEGILDALPDALDLLTVSVEAGLTFEASMARLADKADNELTRSFARALTEIKMGRRRVDAMRDMAARSAVPELEYFVSALIQAEQLGVSTAKVLRIQADEMRIKRRQRAEEQAQKTPVKMSIVLVGLILPALFLVLLGPSVARACRQFGSNVPICK